jgi:hypothetical protein
LAKKYKMCKRVMDNIFDLILLALMKEKNIILKARDKPIYQRNYCEWQKVTLFELNHVQ